MSLVDQNPATQVENLKRKEMSLCQKIWFSNLIYLCNPMSQTVDISKSEFSVIKTSKFSPSGAKFIGIRKFEFVAKTHFILRHEVDYPVKIRVLHNRFKMLVNIK